MFWNSFRFSLSSFSVKFSISFRDLLQSVSYYSFPSIFNSAGTSSPAYSCSNMFFMPLPPFVFRIAQPCRKCNRTKSYDCKCDEAISWCIIILGFSSIGSKMALPCINAFTAILSILLRRRLGRSSANSLTAFAQTVPPTCQLCSQNGQNCLPNAYYTWRSPFYCIG